MERLRVQSDTIELSLADRAALLIGVAIQVRLDREPGRRAGGGNQLDDHGVADQGLAPPGLADEREEFVLDLVPLARARRKVGDGDRDVEGVGKRLVETGPEPTKGQEITIQVPAYSAMVIVAQ